MWWRVRPDAVLERIQDCASNTDRFAVMNAENVAGGFSITPSLADQLLRRRKSMS